MNPMKTVIMKQTMETSDAVNNPSTMNEV